MAPRSLLGPQPPRFLGTDDPWMRVPGHENVGKPKPKAKDGRNWQQKSRDWLNEKGRKYLGPHGDQAFGLLGAASEFTDAADLRDAMTYGGKMGGAVQRGDYWGAAGAAPWMLAASAAAMLPGASMGAADEVAEGTAKGIRAYHGSPHDFDKFDMSRIGTGEGAQAYGHGLYFAENEAVGQGYRDALRRMGDEITFDGKPLKRPRDFTEIQTKLEVDENDWRVYKAVEEITSRQGDLPERLADIRNWYRNQPEMLAAVDRAEKRISLNANPGRMYEVNINADPDAFLDWDKPLSEQPEAVRKALQEYGVQTPETAFNWNGYAGNIGMPTAGGAVKHYAQFLDTGKGIKATVMGKDIGVFSSIEQARSAAEKTLAERGVSPQLFGSDAYAMVAGDYPGNIGARTKPEAAARLAEKGIPGIKYLDAGSRAKGDGSRNYVVFDDRLVSIVKKYGIAGASAILGYNVLSSMDPAQAAQLQQIDGQRQGSGW